MESSGPDGALRLAQLPQCLRLGKRRHGQPALGGERWHTSTSITGASITGASTGMVARLHHLLLVSLILMRTLRQDYAKYARDEDDLDGTDRGTSGHGVRSCIQFMHSCHALLHSNGVNGLLCGRGYEYVYYSISVLTVMTTLCLPR